MSPYQEYPGRSQSSASASHAFKDALQNLQGAGQDSALNGPASAESRDWASDSGETEVGNGCDWATFISAYALGRWDPHQIPRHPRSYSRCTASESASRITSPRLESPLLVSQPHTTESVHDLAPSRAVIHNETSLPAECPSTSSTALIGSPPATQQQHKVTTTKPHLPFQLSLPGSAHRSRNSFSSSSSTFSLASTASSSALSNVDLQTAVATMRWAAARVDISPLALPSPEHELTDPMRGVTAALPYSNQDCVVENVPTSGGTRRSRLRSFWEGTTDVEASDPVTPKPYHGTSFASGAHLEDDAEATSSNPSTVEAVTIPDSGDIAAGASKKFDSDPTVPISFHLAAPPPATAPIFDGKFKSVEPDGSDYFGAIVPKSRPLPDDSSQSKFVTPTVSRSVTDTGTLSVPAVPRRICLTRQTSSPIPLWKPPAETGLGGGRVSQDAYVAAKAGRSAKEEQMFEELGYLVPPNPPDELERRRALYKFNIWNTGPDLNFDRIAHLAKLVFNTREVIISLIDGNEQWFKSEFGSIFTQGGQSRRRFPRAQSICGHAILQLGDEPLVVLDTHQDWRFAKNPLVAGPTRVRFYAAAPLRTQEGFNIGTLAVMDDVPRDEFSPRQRHTLKEFAAVAMREMELWRDKIQLRIRDRIQSSMEQFSRECLESGNEVDSQGKHELSVGTTMEEVYDRAAKLIQSTLDVEGVIVLDVSHVDVLENPVAEGTVSVILHHGDENAPMEKRQITPEEYQGFNRFFDKHPDGKILEGILPTLFRPYMPTHIRYALTVPIYNIDKRPFALICAYNTNDHSKRFLEGHELSYLRAIGVIILSAVLKRRMILADKAKSLFISNISHELRTPLHGILAAAELLSDSPLSHSQMSFIQTVQACGTSLVETVNHVLDFTKLSGNAKSGGVEKVIVPTMTDLMQLIEDAIDGSWIGHRARTAILGDSAIGSVYSPPKDSSPIANRRHLSASPPPRHHVETVIDIGYREQGWLLKFEKSGIRRVLMNLFGNSLKFTTDGYVHVTARSLPNGANDDPKKVRVELSVEDTGKGINRAFKENQLFHPFSQENPLQAGTGLGLAIVGSIVKSESVNGKIDVWSEEGSGTTIRVFFAVDPPEDEALLVQSAQEVQPFKEDDGCLPTVTLLGFESPHRGVQLLKNVISGYLRNWWGFSITADGEERGDIVVVNEDISYLVDAVARKDVSRPFVVLCGARGDPNILSVTSEYEGMGGFCRILNKPGGPTRLRAILKLSVHAVKMRQYNIRNSMAPMSMPGYVSHAKGEADRYSSAAWRRNSDESYKLAQTPSRPAMNRAITVSPLSLSTMRHAVLEQSESEASTPGSVEDSKPTTMITIGSGGSLLRSACVTPVPEAVDARRKARVLVVEDNTILRNLLVKWLARKGYEYKEGVDGLEGVTIYREEGPFDVVLIDLSMPVLDGVAATEQMRRIEAEFGLTTPERPRPTKILALTGMSSLEDKRRAFEAGVDGYLVKPVAFKTLDDMFTKLGIS